jgi:MYXO-CTERM domain-containing protein
MKTGIFKILAAASFALSGMLALPAQAAVPTGAEITALVTGGQLFLLNKFVQHPSDATMGYWGSQSMAETTGAVAALIETGKYNNNAADAAYKAAVDKAVKFIQSKARALPNGGIYDSNDTYVNGLSLVALALYGEQAGLTGAAKTALDTIIDNGMTYAVNAQYAATGGWGYSAGGYPDMSNTQFAAMGLYYGSRYRNVTINPAAAGSWSNKFYGYLKNTMQLADGHFNYQAGSGASIAMTGAGLWSLAMIAQGGGAEALKAIAFLADDSKIQTVYGTTLGATWSGHDYYSTYAIAKALAATLGKDNKLGGATGRQWADDLATALLAQVDVASGVACPAAGAGEHRWCDNLWLMYYSNNPTLATSFMLQSLAFANASTGVVNSILVEDPVAPPPVRGLVTLSTTGGVTITAAVRGNAAARGAKPNSVKMPLDAFDFVLKNVPVGGTTVLTLSIPESAVNTDNPNGFVRANGTLKPNIKWYKVAGASWNGTVVPIEVDIAAKVIRVTLRDGGPEDKDAIPGQITDPGAPGFDDIAPPDPPTGVTATAGIGVATVNFTAPANNGGAAITGYTVTASPGGITATGTASPITVSGLTIGTAYTFTVTATNSAGTGVASAASNSVTPFGTPSNAWGCSMGVDGPADPTLPLLVAAALAYLVRRRRA